jgi:hypothetical protein
VLAALTIVVCFSRTWTVVYGFCPARFGVCNQRVVVSSRD